jgi:hypothetical protein
VGALQPKSAAALALLQVEELQGIRTVLESIYDVYRSSVGFCFSHTTVGLEGLINGTRLGGVVCYLARLDRVHRNAFTCKITRLASIAQLIRGSSEYFGAGVPSSQTGSDVQLIINANCWVCYRRNISSSGRPRPRPRRQNCPARGTASST